MSIILDKVNYVYSEKTAYQIQALKDISLKIEDGEFIGVIGHTGSGKSTLIQHLNGLMRATSGGIYYQGQDIYDQDDCNHSNCQHLSLHPHSIIGDKSRVHCPVGAAADGKPSEIVHHQLRSGNRRNMS